MSKTCAEPIAAAQGRLWRVAPAWLDRHHHSADVEHEGERVQQRTRGSEPAVEISRRRRFSMRRRRPGSAPSFDRIAKQLADRLQSANFVQRSSGLRLGRLLFAPVRRGIAPRLRLLVSGGSRLERETEDRLEAFGWTVLSGYGLAETASLFTGNRPDARRPGSVGLPLADGKGDRQSRIWLVVLPLRVPCLRRPLAEPVVNRLQVVQERIEFGHGCALRPANSSARRVGGKVETVR